MSETPRSEQSEQTTPSQENSADKERQIRDGFEALRKSREEAQEIIKKGDDLSKIISGAPEKVSPDDSNNLPELLARDDLGEDFIVIYEKEQD